MDYQTTDWVLCYLLYLFVASFHILMYSEMTGQGFLTPSHLTRNIHSQYDKSPKETKSDEINDVSS
jgi:hypothetical protein